MVYQKGSFYIYAKYYLKNNITHYFVFTIYMPESDQYNVYNNYDPQFINYAELYKTPQEMREKTEYLINDYADALITGNSDVYKNNPDLVGNRYFIDTQTQCLDMDDPTSIQTRSVLIDNVNESAMQTTNDGNKGLMYSLLASLKLINSEKLFDGSSDNEPTPNIKNLSTDYLKNDQQPQLPLCREVSVYTNDSKNDNTSGWVIDNDYNNIDPDAIVESFSGKEGFGLNVADTMNSSSGDGTLSTFAQNTQTNAENAQAFAESHAEALEESTAEANKEASSIAAKGGPDSKHSQKQQGDFTKNAQSSQTESGLSAFNKAKQKGLGSALKNDTKKYLEENKNISTFELLKRLINMTYPCGDDDDPTNLRIPGKCLEAIFSNVKDEIIESKDALRKDLCDRYYFFQPIVFKSFVDELVKSINENKSNNKSLDIPGLPKPNICVYREEDKSGIWPWSTRKVRVRREVESYDYNEYVKIINEYRENIAQEIVRYKNVGFFGHCPIIESCHTFKKGNVIDYTAYIYIIALLFIFVYIVYRFMFRFFNFKKYIKNKNFFNK